MSEEELLTRKAVKHQVIRRYNERIAELGPDHPDLWPDQLWMHPATLEELLLDGDFDTYRLMDFEGKEFMKIPVVGDPRLELGVIEIHWPGEPAREVAS